MSSVFVVLDTAHRPLDPVHPGTARRLLARGQAAVWRRSPFTLLLKRAVPEAAPHPLRLTLAPDSRSTGLALLTAPEMGTGGRTKWNRTQRLGLPKTHWRDAACMGASTPERRLLVAGVRLLAITATGRHARHLCRRDRCGFPRTGPKATSTVGRLRTGALVQAVVPPPSVQADCYVGRLAVRASGSGTITTARHDVVVVQGIAVRHCHLLQRSDDSSSGSGSSAVATCQHPEPAEPRTTSTSTGGGACSPCLKAGVAALEIR